MNEHHSSKLHVSFNCLTVFLLPLAFSKENHKNKSTWFYGGEITNMREGHILADEISDVQCRIYVLSLLQCIQVLVCLDTALHVGVVFHDTIHQCLSMGAPE